MDQTVEIAAHQLSRMRGMTRYYHERFFSDIRLQVVLTIALFVVGLWEVEGAFLLVPVVALYGAVQTAFDASYLIFARQYAARLEAYINGRLDDPILVAAKLEATYLFPLDDRKIVTAAFGSGFSYFGFVTLFFTVLGVATYTFGLILGLSFLDEAGSGWTLGYLGSLFATTALAVTVGWWWFVGGEGERRLRSMLDSQFPTQLEDQ
ncbi:MAG: hypothetical protein OER12_11110 [Acidimicrobiia bacterium]|nr:hypothetical protein [Acidimicrobiia bacterium]